MYCKISFNQSFVLIAFKLFFVHYDYVLVIHIPQYFLAWYWVDSITCFTLTKIFTFCHLSPRAQGS